MKMKSLLALLLAVLWPVMACAEVDGMALRQTEGSMVYTDGNGVDTVIRTMAQPFMGTTELEDGELIAYLDYLDCPNEEAIFLRLTFSLVTPELLAADTLRVTVGKKHYTFPVSASIHEYDTMYFEDYALCLTEASLPLLQDIIRQKGKPVAVTLEQEDGGTAVGEVTFPAEQVQAILARYKEVGGMTQPLERFDSLWPVEITK
ncbi:MAG: hypothetical protein ACI4MJ_09135 [Aristaeellaceae bacterium]